MRSPGKIFVDKCDIILPVLLSKLQREGYIVYKIRFVTYCLKGGSIWQKTKKFL
jgi:hypothetical protein